MDMPEAVYQHLLARSRAVSEKTAMTVDEIRIYAGRRRHERDVLRRSKVEGAEI